MLPPLCHIYAFDVVTLRLLAVCVHEVLLLRERPNLIGYLFPSFLSFIVWLPFPPVFIFFDYKMSSFLSKVDTPSKVECTNLRAFFLGMIIMQCCMSKMHALFQLFECCWLL